MQQDVVHRLRSPLCGVDEDTQVLPARFLADEFGKDLRPQRRFRGVLDRAGRGDGAIAHRASSFRLSRITASSPSVLTQPLRALG